MQAPQRSIETPRMPAPQRQIQMPERQIQKSDPTKQHCLKSADCCEHITSAKLVGFVLGLAGLAVLLGPEALRLKLDFWSRVAHPSDAERIEAKGRSQRREKAAFGSAASTSHIVVRCENS